VLEAAASLDTTLFENGLEETGSTTCGRWPLALLFDTLGLRGAADLFGQRLDYQTSGEVTGGYGHSVSYGALGWWPEESFRLGEEETRTLLGSASATLEHLRSTGERRPIHATERTPALERPAGVFVSLHQRGELLGCIGSWSEDVPLWRRVPDMTLAAAMDDPRFSPAGRTPGGIDIEISIMTPMKRVRDVAGFRVGVDGAFLQHGWHRGILLPQVGRGPGWTAARFLDALARKAALGPGAHEAPGVRLSTFRAQIIE
jgi:AmmeMemoRadiSam system protein A